MIGMKRYKDWRRRQIQNKIEWYTTLLEADNTPPEAKTAAFWKRNGLYTKLKEMA